MVRSSMLYATVGPKYVKKLLAEDQHDIDLPGTTPLSYIADLHVLLQQR